ncbi:MAG: polysaccharide deacetylase family protein [Candidatus Babeliales bacterium]|jgi:peptidoglycan/xylan/chitin deacetylase (PgdA/CDA1 family)
MIFAALVLFVVSALGLAVTTIPNTPQVFGSSVRHVTTDEKVVALTYDDGPRPPTTQAVLEVLAQHHVPATFFLIGRHAELHPALVKKIYSAGHELGNHTYSHPYLIFKSARYVRNQIEKTDNIIRSCGYKKEIYFRSPHGMKLFADSWALKKMKRKNILFDTVAWDWTSPGVEKIVHNVMKDVHPGSIILLHDGCGDKHDVVEASDIIITRLKEQGYQFVTISELLKKNCSVKA